MMENLFARALPGDVLEVCRRKLRVVGRWTSVAMERAFWDSFDAICAQTGILGHTLSARIDARRKDDVGLTCAMRTFVLTYFRVKIGAKINPGDACSLALNEVSADEPQKYRMLELKDRLAPYITKERANMIESLSRSDLSGNRCLGTEVRFRWRGAPLWQPDDDVFVDTALREMLAKRRR